MIRWRQRFVVRWQPGISLSVLLIAIIWPSFYQRSCALVTLHIADPGTATLSSLLDSHLKTDAERRASESSLNKRAGPSQPIPIPRGFTRLNPQALSDNDVGPEPTGPMSDTESGPDVGDATDDDIFGAWEEASLGAMPEVHSGPNQFTYPGPESAQKPLRNLPLGAWDDLWQAAEDRGLALRKALDHYAGCRKNRLADLEAKERPGDMELFYQTTSYSNQDLRDDYNELDTLFEQSDVSFAGVENPQSYTIVNVRVRDAPPAVGEVISVGINTDTDTMLSLSSWRKEDINGDDYRLRSSELTWQTWRSFAGRNARKLRYMGRIRITNQESQNVMTLAHRKYPDNVDQIPLGRAGEPLGPAAGHGKWTPNDPAFNALLSTPNVKPVMHMLADHAAELDNNYIVEIHTMPEIARYMGTIQYRNTARPEDYRDSNMMIVLGPKPAGLATEGSCSGGQPVAAADTVATS